MDCVTSWWNQYPTSLGDGPSHCHTYVGVCIGNASWRAFDLSTLSSAWSRRFCPDQGHCGQIGAPIWVVAPWPVLVLPQATPLGPGDSVLPGSIPCSSNGQTHLRPLLGGPPGVPDWQEQPGQQWPWQGPLWVATQVSEADWYPRGPWVQFLIGSSWNHRGRQLGSTCWFSKHMSPHAVSPDTCVAMDANSPKQGNGNLLGGQTSPWTSPRQNPLDAVWF